MLHPTANMKRPIALFALLGLVGCFLPLGMGVSFFELRHLDWLPVVLMTAAFAAPLVATLTSGVSNIVPAITGLAGFGYVVFKFGTALWDLVIHADIGGKMMGVAAVGGIISSLLALADRKRA